VDYVEQRGVFSNPRLDALRANYRPLLDQQAMNDIANGLKALAESVALA
jgi:hypothetical protein